VRARVKAIPTPLKLLLLVGLVLSWAWSFAMPPLQGFDEPDHAGYAIQLATTGHAPSPTGGSGSYAPSETAMLFSLGYNALKGNKDARPPFSPLDVRAYDRYVDGLPASTDSQGSGPNPLGKNPPLYYAYEAVPYWVTRVLGGELPAQLTWMRLWSSLLFLGTIACAWLAAGEVFRRSPLAQVAATGFVALQPMAGYEAGMITPDTALAFGMTGLLWLTLRLVRLGFSPGRVIAAAAVALCCVLVHGRGVAALGVLLLALLVAFLRRPLGRRDRAIKVLLCGGGVLVVLLAVALVQAGALNGLYGGELNFGRTFSVSRLLQQTWEFYLPPLRFMAPRLGPDYGFGGLYVQTYFGSFASFDVGFPMKFYDLVQLALVAVALGVVGVLVRRWEPLVRERWWQLALVAGFFAIVVGLLHLASYRALANGTADPLITGRYQLPIPAVIGLALGVCVAAARRAGPLLAAAALGGVTLISLSGLAATVSRFYT
jgi:hypothetical protein